MKKETTEVIKNTGFPWENLFPDILWISFWLFLLFITKEFIKKIITALLNRVKHGAGMKIGSFELDGLKVSGNNNLSNNHFEISEDQNNMRGKDRANVYKLHRGAMLTHKIFKSKKDGQLYDILIYVIPNKSSNLIQVKSVEYYFGKFWGHKIFTSNDRSNGFAIATSAYGPFLCTAKINFNDGKSELVYRYIDFEMGNVAEITNDE
ncbi:hypothetical protein EZY14_004480 [Kordia sp. TARA_039_SRF]|nr:hypothetical protein EZY14_004480 [Kordia sp. TARA_039_SRF]